MIRKLKALLFAAMAVTALSAMNTAATQAIEAQNTSRSHAPASKVMGGNTIFTGEIPGTQTMVGVEVG
jgi:hypothetical protein